MKQVNIGLNGFEERAYRNKDIQSFRKNHGLSTAEFAEVFCRGGMSPSAFQAKFRNDEDFLSPSLQILLRLYCRFPEVIPRQEKTTATEFFDTELGGEEAVATRFRAVLFGVDRNSSYNWNKDSTPIAQVRVTMAAAKKLKQINNLKCIELLQVLIDIFNATTQSLGVNPMKKGSWGRKDGNDEALHLAINDVSEKAVKNRGRRVNLENEPKLKTAYLASTVRERLSYSINKQ